MRIIFLKDDKFTFKTHFNYIIYLKYNSIIEIFKNVIMYSRGEKMKINFLIIGAACSKNKGAAALLKSTVNTLKQIYKNSTFIVLSPYSEFDEKKNCPDMYFWRGADSKTRILNIYKKRSEFDFLIDLSGDMISDDYGKMQIINLLYNIIIYKILLKKPYIIYAQSLGPFNNIITRTIAKYCFNKVDLLIIREKYTENCLNKLKINNYILGADPAFLLEKARKDKVIEILENEKIPINEKPKIGINVSDLMYQLYKNQDRSAKYIEITAKFIDYIIDNYNANVILTPHALNDNFDDRTVSYLVYAKIKNKGSTYVIDGDYSPEEIKGIIGEFDIFIGARMHATIASTSCYVPTIGIAYSHKMHGIIGEMLGLENYVIDMDDLTYEILLKKFIEVWENRYDIQSKLKKVMLEVKNKSMKNAELIKNL